MLIRQIYIRLLIITMVTPVLFLGCSTIQALQVSGGDGACYDLCGATPFVYGGAFNALRRSTLTCNYSGERGLGYLVTFPLLFPAYIVDIPLSFVADTIIIPYTAYQQVTVGNICSER